LYERVKPENLQLLSMNAFYQVTACLIDVMLSVSKLQNIKLTAHSACAACVSRTTMLFTINAPILQDHLAIYPSERTRIEKAGGFVTDGRLQGRMQVGDHWILPVVLAIIFLPLAYPSRVHIDSRE
jgi:hypothetical protein